MSSPFIRAAQFLQLRKLICHMLYAWFLLPGGLRVLTESAVTLCDVSFHGFNAHLKVMSPF